MKQVMKAVALTTLLTACLDHDELAPDQLAETEAPLAAVPGTTYSIVHGSGRCLDVPSFARSSGQPLQGFACKAAGYLGNQQFTLEAVPGGYRIRAFDSQLCLDLPSSSTADGTIVQQSQCHGGTNQVWSFLDEPGGKVQLRSALDLSKCTYLDAANALRLGRCNALAATARTFELGRTRTHASFRQGTQCLDLASSSAASGLSPQLFGCKTTDTGNQEWTLEPVASGTFRLRSQSSGKCLDLRAGALTNGTVVEQQSCTSSNTQRWMLSLQPSGQAKLQNVASARCADYYNGALRQWTCTAFGSQLFAVQPGAAAALLPSVSASPPPTTGPAGLWAVDPNLIPPLVTGDITQDAIVVRWTVTDPRITEQRLLVWDETPGVPGGPGPVEFRLPATQRAFWIEGLRNTPLVAGHRYTATVLTMSGSGVSASPPSSSAVGVLPGAAVTVGIQPGGQVFSPRVIQAISFVDDDGDGLVDGQPAGAGTFPRFPAGPSAASTTGNQFASNGVVRANAIVGFVMEEGTAQQPHRTFAVAHLFVHPMTGATTVTGVFYGDLDTNLRSQVWAGDSAVGPIEVLPGDGLFAPNILRGSVTAPAMANDGTFRVITFDYVLALDPA